MKGQPHLPIASLGTRNGKQAWSGLSLPLILVFFHSFAFLPYCTQAPAGRCPWESSWEYLFKSPLTLTLLFLSESHCPHCLGSRTFQEIHGQERERVVVTHKEAVNLTAVCGGRDDYQRSRKGDGIVCHRVTPGAC